MMETWKMWRLIRYLKKHQHEFTDWDHIDIEGFVDTGTPVDRHQQTLVNIVGQSRYPVVFRPALVKEFGEKPYWKRFPAVNPPRNLGEEEKKVRYDFLEKSVADAQQRIIDCVRTGFLGEDEQYRQLIFLTLQGRKFATSYGLIKEWMLNDIGEMRSVIVAIVGTVGIIKWRVAWDFIRELSPVVFKQ